MNLIIKGFIIGLGKIIPGVSGSMLAISLGIYNDIIKNIANIKKNFTQKSKYLMKIGIGIMLAIVLTSKIIVKCLNKHYLATMLLFIGMIIGGTPELIKNTQFKKKDIIIFPIITIFITITNNIRITSVHIIEYSISEIIKLIIIGIIDSVTSIVPGISGTAILMILGYYNIIIEAFSKPSELKKIFVLLPFITGFIVGIIITSKVLNIIINKYNKTMNKIILIFTSLTIFLLTKEIISRKKTIIEIIIGMILSVSGFLTTYKLENKKRIK